MKLSKLSQPNKRRLIWAGSLVVSLTAHYCILKNAPIDNMNSPRQRLSTDSETPHALFARLVEDSSVNIELQSSRIVAPLPPAHQNSSSLDTSNEKDNRLDGPPFISGEKPKRSGENLKGFFTFEEVDEPATPREDWEMPLKAIGAMGIKFLVIRVWIKENGDVRDIEVLSSTPQTLMAQDREKIISALLQTKMTPAIKGGAQCT